MTNINMEIPNELHRTLKTQASSKRMTLKQYIISKLSDTSIIKDVEQDYDIK